MVIAFLSFALIGLWTPIAVALVVAYWIGSSKPEEAAAEGDLAPLTELLSGRRVARKRLECSVCGSETLRTVPCGRNGAAHRKSPDEMR
jgi:hypothetical protein